MTTKSKKFFAVAVSVLLLTFTIVSLLFIVKEADHDCTGTDCPVCASIHQAEQTLRNMGSGIVAVAAIIPALFTACYVAIRILILPSICPVQQKVRLDC